MKKIRKWINKLLRDKDEFHKDYALRAKVEMHNLFLEQVIELEKDIVPAKLEYFWENKKAFLARLFLKIIAVISIIGGILIGAWFFGFRYNPDPPKTDKTIVLYITDKTDTAYIKDCIPKVRFIMIYPPDPHKDWNAYKEAMHSRFETSGMSDSASYLARRMDIDKKTGNPVPSQFWGRYQLGYYARKACGIEDMPWEEFSRNPEIQEGTFLCWIRLLYGDMAPYIARYEGRIMAGYQLTASGIISMTHNVGADSTIIFLKSNGTIIPRDKNGNASRYLSLGGYNLSSILE